MKILLVFLSLLTSQHSLGQTKTYSIVFLNKKHDAEKIDKATNDKLMEGHMANINRLAKEGKLLAAGPFEGGGGLFIFNTTSQEEPESWVSSDPAVQANRWNIEILPYTPRKGLICPVSEPYEMILYTLVRFDAIVDKFTASTYPGIIRKHDQFVSEIKKNSNVITEAIFGDNEGGILIVKEEIPTTTFDDDPGVQQGLLNVQMKKLYIAKGSFCEH